MSSAWPCLLTLIGLVLPGLGNDNGTAGAGRCQRPEVMKMIPAKEEFYNVGDSMMVQCEAGYRPSQEAIRCIHGQNGVQWDHYPWCVEQCEKPADSTMYTISGEKPYYDVRESVSVRCIPGYRPLYERITCVTRQNKDQWDKPPQCIGVKVTSPEVTSTSVRLRIVCSPDQCDDTGKSYIFSCIYLRGSYKGCNAGNDVTFSGLQPFTQYEIRITRVFDRKWYSLETIYITTKETVPRAPDIVHQPSMEDSTIAWKLNSDKGQITEYELKINGRRDYNSSFSVNVTYQFPPNVTQYKINLQHGTNYTFQLRGFTSVGGGEYSKTTLETTIGDPPDPKFEKKDFTVKLYPVPDVHGPISHYELIIFTRAGSNTSDCLQVTDAHYNASPTAYMAALLPAHNLTGSITLGDNRHYGGFLNAPLTPNLEYAAYVRVTSKWKEEKSSCVFLGFFAAEEPFSSASHVIWGSKAALLLLLVLLVLTVLWRTGYYRRKVQRKEEIPLKPGLGGP